MGGGGAVMEEMQFFSEYRVLMQTSDGLIKSGEGSSILTPTITLKHQIELISYSFASDPTKPEELSVLIEIVGASGITLKLKGAALFILDNPF